MEDLASPIMHWFLSKNSDPDLVGSSEQLTGETLELSRARLVAKVLPCYDSLQAAAAHRGSLRAGSFTGESGCDKKIS